MVKITTRKERDMFVLPITVAFIVLVAVVTDKLGIEFTNTLN